MKLDAVHLLSKAEDWPPFKHGIRTYLTFKGCWHVVERELDDENAEDAGHNATARAGIYCRVDYSFQVELDDCVTAHDCWEHLSSIFEPMSISAVSNLKAQLQNMVMQPDEKVLTYIGRGLTLRSRLANPATFTEPELIYSLCTGLSSRPEFNSISSILRHDPPFTISSLRQKLQEEESSVERSRAANPAYAPAVVLAAVDGGNQGAAAGSGAGGSDNRAHGYGGGRGTGRGQWGGGGRSPGLLS